MRQFKVQKTAYTNRDSITIEKYLADLHYMPVLSQDEEVELAYQSRKGNLSARNRLIMGNLRFVVSVAKQYQHPGLNLEDLINEGNIGLITAAERYDETRGFKFISYAVWWIRQQIINAIADKGYLVRIPANKNQIVNSIEKQINKFQQEHQRTPSAEELAEIMDLSEFEVSNLILTRTSPLSFDTPINDQGDSTVHDIFIDRSAKSTDNKLVDESLRHDLLRLMKSVLEDREIDIIISTFKNDESLEEVGRRLKIGRERVRQLRTRAIRKLQNCPEKKILLSYLSN